MSNLRSTLPHRMRRIDEKSAPTHVQAVLPCTCLPSSLSCISLALCGCLRRGKQFQFPDWLRSTYRPSQWWWRCIGALFCGAWYLRILARFPEGLGPGISQPEIGRTKRPMSIALNNSSKPHYRCTSEILSRTTGFPELSRASPIASNQSKKGGSPWQTET
jgi:hypothetical protein